jgi:predicted CoA-substrate-specific enzyme activase
MTEKDILPETAGTPATASGDHVVYYPCKYVPAELLAGFGASCRPVAYEATSFEEADRLAHPNLCGYGKSLLSFAMQPDVHALVLTSCCDVIRRIYDVLAASDELDFLFLVDLPHKRGPLEARRFRGELARLADAYAAYTGCGFDAGAAVASFPPKPRRRDEHISVVGAHASASLLDTCGAQVSLPLENLTCTGARLMETPPPELGRAPRTGGCDYCTDGQEADDDTTAGATPPEAAPLDAFLDWYAPVLLGQLPCMRMDDISGRRSLIGATGQDGIIYHTMKFCDYYGFEYLEAAKEAHMPMLKIETDGTRASAGQLRTRLRAFDETLHGVADKGRSALRRTGDGQTYVLGVDSGSTSTDAVIMDIGEDGEPELVASVIVATGAKATAGASKAVAAVLEQAHLSRADMAVSVATGYGRDAIPNMDTTITEITCHAAGAHFLDPAALTIVDIGGQDSKVIHLSDTGAVVNFVMNDKCAAGTGRFLEMMATTLEMPLDEFCAAGLDWKHEVRISNMCTVFATSEVVSLVADDTPVPDIVHGLDVAVATKTAALAKRVKAEPPYLMTGGVANNEGVVRSLSEVLGSEVSTHEDSQLCGAIGAALLGLESLGEKD